MNSKNKNNKELNDKMKDLISFKTEDEILEFDSVILHLKTMKNIQKLLIGNQKNRQWLADRLSVNKSFISQLFSGSKILNFKLLSKINKIFKTDIEISFNPKNTFEIDTKSKIIDLSKIHPGFLGTRKFKDEQKSNIPVQINEDFYNYNQIMV